MTREIVNSELIDRDIKLSNEDAEKILASQPSEKLIRLMREEEEEVKTYHSKLIERWLEENRD